MRPRVPGDESLEGIGTERVPRELGKTKSSLPPLCSSDHSLRAMTTSDRSGVHRIFRPLPRHRTWAPAPNSTSLASEGGDFAVAQARLNGEKKERSVSPADPRSRIGSGGEGVGLFLRKKLNRTPLIPFGGDREDPLAVECECRFVEGRVAEEGMQGRKAIVSALWRVAPFALEIVKELP